MAIIITPISKKNPLSLSAPILYYPKAVKTGEIDLEELSEQIAYSSSLTKADCYTAIISSVVTVSKRIECGKNYKIRAIRCFSNQCKRNSKYYS